ncbi:hypothetical protein Tco_0449160 [Tanacetum coccineum]
MSQPANDEFSQHLSDDEASNHEDASDTGAAPKQQQQVIPQTTAISNIKLPILKKEEYDIWAMEMEHYLEYIDNDVWKVIQMKLQEEKFNWKRMVVFEYFHQFHGIDYAKEIWEAIRTRFGGNANSKKMQKAVYKQQFEAFTIYSSESLKRDRQFRNYVLSWQLMVLTYQRRLQILSFAGLLPPKHGPKLAMTMKTKPDVDTLAIDDLDNEPYKSNTNKVKSGFTHAYSTCTPSTSSTNIPEKEAPASFAMKKESSRVDGKALVVFDKKKLGMLQCTTLVLSREWTANGDD